MKTKRGFSLIEILIALGVMLVGIVGVVALFPAGLRSAKVSDNLTRATILAERELEDIKRAGYSSLPAPPDTSSWTQFPATADADFWWRRIVDNTSPAVNNLLEVEIQIGWNDQGESYTNNYISFVTYVANN